MISGSQESGLRWRVVVWILEASHISSNAAMVGSCMTSKLECVVEHVVKSDREGGHYIGD